MPWIRVFRVWFFCLCFLPVDGRADVPSSRVYTNAESNDQDDMCVWLHPDDGASSTVITSDKYAGKIFVYDLNGELLQSISTGKPGNIDVRYGLSLSGECVDLVALNERDQDLILVYKVNVETRLLERVDDGNIHTGSNYGFALYRHADGTLFAFAGEPVVRKYHLYENASGQISGEATSWSFQAGVIEGMVADDETGNVFLASETQGIYKLPVDDSSNATLIAAVGDDGLSPDVEGLTIYYAGGGEGYLIASSQGVGKFTVFQRQAPHAGVGNFQISDVSQTDGIDVVNVGLGPDFPQGMFLCHNGSNCCPVQAARWDTIAAELGGLLVDTQYWDPRACPTSTDTEESTGTPPQKRSSIEAFPNPFNPRTRLRFELAEASRIELSVFNSAGQRLAVLAKGLYERGVHEYDWRALGTDGKRLASGVYVAHLRTAAMRQSTKLVLLR